MSYPRIIQGGMGVAISDWRLARAVGQAGQMGVVAGTALDLVHARRLADGDEGGHLRWAYAHFPVEGVAERVLERYFSAGGRDRDRPYPSVPAHSLVAEDALVELTVLANFAEVLLARRGHSSPIGINYLEKIQLPTPYSLYGALLAGVDYVLMGAGIPLQVPAALRRLARGEAVSYRVTVEGADASAPIAVHFDPARSFGPTRERPRPRFLAIVASNTLAQFLAKNSETAPDGFVVEGPVAGGHNAPPRGKLQLDDLGQPIYGAGDVVDLARVAKLGLPFWVAGGYARPDKYAAARESGAEGVQLGSAFAFCAESGIDPAIKREVLRRSAAGELTLRTDAFASPSGYPFKVVQLEGTLSDPLVREGRTRICDLGYLRTLALDERGELVYRCPSEPVRTFVRKGGSEHDTAGRACLCNGLMATAGLGQVRGSGPEPPVVTGGDDVLEVARFLAPGADSYSAADVIAHVLGRAARPRAAANAGA